MAPKDSSKKRKSADSTISKPAVNKRAKTARSPARVPTTKSSDASTKPSTTAPPNKKIGKSGHEKQVPEKVDLDFAGFGSDSDDEDDQTAALIAGLDSDDEQDGGVEIDGEAPAKAVPSIPESSDLQKKLEVASTADNEGPGTIYVGRLPHGFYEHQMKAYFSQFGDINRLRMAHNRRTGASKHYAFIEFTSAEVAKIVADTMDSYLMYGHILKVKFLPKEKIHAKLWEGAGKRFRKIPWNRIEKNRLEKSDREGWKKRNTKEEKRRSKKLAALKELGYEYTAPALQDVEQVQVKEVNGKSGLDQESKEEPQQQTPKQIEAAPEEPENLVEGLINRSKTAGKKSKKGAGSNESVLVQTTRRKAAKA